MVDVKLVFLGDGGVGRSSFICCARDYTPCDCCSVVNIMVNGKTLSVGLWKTYTEKEDYARLRPLSYQGAHAFLACFDVANRASFQNVIEKWIPEVRQFDPNIPILLLGTKTDLRGANCATDQRSIVTRREGKALAESLGVTYAECSSKLRYGLRQAIKTAIGLFLNPQRSSGIKRFFKTKSKKSNSAKGGKPVFPVLPPSAFAPDVEVLTSSFSSDWKTMMSDTDTADVRFVFSDGKSVDAHKTILTAISSIFKNIFLGEGISSHESYGHIFEDISWVRNKDSSCPNLIHIKGQCQNEGKMVVKLEKSISEGVFMEVLTFLYTGSAAISEEEDINLIKEIQSVAEKFQLSWLAEYCANVVKEEAYLNDSLSIWLNDNTGLAAKKLFLNKPLQSDAKFRVEGSIVYGHRVILKARSEVMAAMLGGAFRESDMDTEIEIQDVSLENFLAILEYLYTDHAPIEEGDSVGIMILANRFCLPRLVTLCEVSITKKMDSVIQKRVADVTSDIIKLLLTSKAHNAKQLSRWCLHVIATNYSVFESTEEFDLVQEEIREYVNEHACRWPPLRVPEEYEKKVKSSDLNSKCKAM